MILYSRAVAFMRCGAVTVAQSLGYGGRGGGRVFGRAVNTMAKTEMIYPKSVGV